MGIANRAPLSFTPRRLAVAMKPMARSASRTLEPASEGTAAVMAAMPEDTDTATVRT